ncbi:cyclic GMP-AMP synthase-like receptor isoform X1 [Hydra vulgaris]|uniref:cyclic GMP-AMP synthase-like receptor isoform X1 n=1 Tax=Hydra vulgaris TaxID=6087 RepID=UPI001F5E5CC3|nr:uncharacterized protein LOC105846279 isoform X1 [Hydra vulgaris]
MALNDLEWFKKKTVCDAIERFHRSKATVPNINRAKEDLKEIMNLLEDYLKENHNLCDKVYYAGSAFESLNIAEEVPEFDVMLVVKKKQYLKIINQSNGFCTIKCTNKMVWYPVDKNGNLVAGRFRHEFKGIVQKWVNVMTKEMKKEICVVEHGVATQIDVSRNGNLWYHVDLVPCFEVSSLGNRDKIVWCVPKPIDENKDLWRISYSQYETQEANKLHANAKMCIRIVKTLFKLETNGLFKKFTSYHIKTVAFHLNKESWPDERSIGKTVYDFLFKTMNFLEQCNLKHFFNSQINILDSNKIKYEQLANTIQGWLRSEQSFMKVFAF